MTLQVLNLPPGRLRPGPFNPRKQFPPESLQELAASLRQVGVLEPILVRPLPLAGDPAGGEPAEPIFEIVAGERRYRAALLAELPEVPCLIRALDDTAALEHAVLENLQREDLQPLEEADGFAALIERGGYTVAQLADRLGKSVRHVYGRLALRKLAPELVEAVATRRLPASAGELIIAAAGEERHWPAAAHQRQLELAAAVGLLAEGAPTLSVRDIRRRLRDHETTAAEQARATEAQFQAEQQARDAAAQAQDQADQKAERKRRREEKARLTELQDRLTPILAQLDPWEIIRRILGQGTPIPAYCHTRIATAFADLLEAKPEAEPPADATAKPRRKARRKTRTRRTGATPTAETP
jgi:ParB/RepB/Spo0J family partition protein